MVLAERKQFPELWGAHDLLAGAHQNVRRSRRAATDGALPPAVPGSIATSSLALQALPQEHPPHRGTRQAGTARRALYREGHLPVVRGTYWRSATTLLLVDDRLQATTRNLRRLGDATASSNRHPTWRRGPSPSRVRHLRSHEVELQRVAARRGRARHCWLFGCSRRILVSNPSIKDAARSSSSTSNRSGPFPHRAYQRHF